jgi:hypothetical protein
MAKAATSLRTGWFSRLTRVCILSTFVLTITGLAVTLAPFHAVVQWSVILHTALGLLALAPLLIYLFSHWQDYRRFNLSDVVVLGYAAGIAFLLCLASGVVVTWQSLFGLKLSVLWRNVHLYSTLATLACGLPHAFMVWLRIRRGRRSRAPRRLLWQSLAGAALVVLVAAGLTALYGGQKYVNEFPEDYSYLYGEERPFAPSLATTSTGGAFAAESLAGSETCGTAGCHSQIFEEWQPSAHRYAAMDPLFQKVQSVMAEQNGPESTRYCGGCHDPISLFSGTKNIFAENLTELSGYNEGISCLGCHGVRETDLQGNANYVMTQPSVYLWQWQKEGLGKFISDFLIRSYPDEHQKLSKRMFKAPEYCAACHKQFIDQEVNRVGWVQLQNQYDNWKASHWFVEGDPARTIECRECHMPLVASTDPARGDDTDYNRTPQDDMHRSHRFLGANAMVPAMLKLEGWQEQVRLTEEWLKGTYPIPEIEEKWRQGPVVQLALEVPPTAIPGKTLPIRVVMTANKVGHDFPTGPLDIIQSWIELHVFDQQNQEIFTSGTRDERHFIAPGSFLFKAEAVDQYGNLIDRHNLWEMVGVRYRRALFPGYSDTVEYLVDCPIAIGRGEGTELARTGKETQAFEVPLSHPLSHTDGEVRIVAKLMYRKVDQYLINFLLGEDSGLTAPVVEMNRITATVPLSPAQALASPADPTSPASPARSVGTAAGIPAGG